MIGNAKYKDITFNSNKDKPILKPQYIKENRSKPEDNKVYCKNCKYLDFDSHSLYICKVEEIRNWFGTKIITKLNDPMIKNHDCNCLDYKRKWWKFWMR